MEWLILIPAILGFAVLFILAVKMLYRVVPVNEAHIRIMMSRKSVFSAREKKSAYWFIPVITRIHKLPLSNLAIPVNDVKLNDQDMAKFVCDIMCFVNINKLELAVERLTLTDTSTALGFDLKRLQIDLQAILESIGRTVATKQTILEIYMDRQKLDDAITKEVQSVFPKWGLELVDLELKDIKDAEDSSIIHDIERKIAAQITRDADIKTAQMEKEAKLKEAEAMEEYRKREVARDREIAMAEQKKNLEVAQKEALANEQKVEAKRKLDVGNADVAKSVIERQADAEQYKLTIEAEGRAQETLKTGNAEADIIKAKKVAEAEGTEKMALALKQFDEVAIRTKLLEIMKDVQLGKYKSLAEAMQNADIKWIISGAQAQNFFGLNLNAEGGANLDQFLKESEIGDMDMGAVKDGLSKMLKTFTEAKDDTPPDTGAGNGGI